MKHPLKLGAVYEFRADIRDADDQLVAIVKPATRTPGVRDLATTFIDAVNASTLITPPVPQRDDAISDPVTESENAEFSEEAEQGGDDQSPADESTDVNQHSKKKHRHGR